MHGPPRWPCAGACGKQEAVAGAGAFLCSLPARALGRRCRTAAGWLDGQGAWRAGAPGPGRSRARVLPGCRAELCLGSCAGGEDQALPPATGEAGDHPAARPRGAVSRLQRGFWVPRLVQPLLPTLSRGPAVTSGGSQREAAGAGRQGSSGSAVLTLAPPGLW